MDSMDPLSSTAIKYVVHHIFLPIRLPQCDDHDIENDLAICDILINRAAAFKECLPDSHATVWISVVKMLHRLQGLYATTIFDEERLHHLMQSLELEGFTLSCGHDISLIQPDRFSSPTNSCTKCMFDHAQSFGSYTFRIFRGWSAECGNHGHYWTC